MVYLLIIITIIILDLSVKEIIKKKYTLKKLYPIKNNLFICHIKNTGIALSLFKNRTKEIIYITFALIISISAILIYGIRKGFNRIFLVSLSCIIGGALANFIDRVKNKEVTDFLYYKKWNLPVFNLADFFIIFGGIISSIIKLLEKNN